MCKPIQDECRNPGWGVPFTCPGCHADLDDKWEGKSGPCPSCGRFVKCTIEDEPVSVCRLVADEEPKDGVMDRSTATPPRRIRLHVEDRGQDCIWFDIEDGVIVDCLFQQNIWTKRPVAPERVLTGSGGDCNDWRVGDMIGFVDDCATLNYPVIKVEHRPQPEES